MSYKPKDPHNQPAARAARAFLRGNPGKTFTSPDAAIRAGVPEEEWLAMLEGENVRFWTRNGRRARRSSKRHPVRVSEEAAD